MDTVAIVDRSSKGLVRFLDLQGKPISDPLTHWEEVVEVGLNQTGPTLERRIVWLDSNRDLYVSSTSVTRQPPKRLAAQVASFAWVATADVLAAVVDGALLVWHSVAALNIDSDLASLVQARNHPPQCPSA